MSHYIDIHSALKFVVLQVSLSDLILCHTVYLKVDRLSVSVLLYRLSGIISRELTLTFTPIANSGNASCKSLCTHCIRAMYYIHSFSGAWI